MKPIRFPTISKPNLIKIRKKKFHLGSSLDMEENGAWQREREHQTGHSNASYESCNRFLNNLQQYVPCRGH